MGTQIIYGASDDLIEFDGGLYEEIGAFMNDDGTYYLACSDGTLLSVKYDGEWRFGTIKSGGSFDKIIHSLGDDGEHKEFPKASSYSDVVVFTEPISWAVFGTHIAK